MSSVSEIPVFGSAISIPVPATQTAAVEVTASAAKEVTGLARPIPQQAEAPAPPAAGPRQDKGEVIWSAELTVMETAPAAPLEAPVSAESDAPRMHEEPAFAVAVENPPQDETAGQGGGEQQAESGAENRQSRKQAAESEPARSAVTVKTSGAGKREAEPPPAERLESKPAAAPPHPGFPAEFSSRDATGPEMKSVAAAESVTLEPAAPLRPTRIATVQVDVPAPAGSADATPLRLVVSQRGDQVNVRLRSWDAGATPIENSRMQPLLNSLAEKGFVSEKHLSERTGGPVAERAPEKQMAMADTASAGNEQQAFQDANGRQQKNQERQQQQQAFFLRKQMRNVRPEEFNLQTILDGGNGLVRQGAQR